MHSTWICLAWMARTGISSMPSSASLMGDRWVLTPWRLRPVRNPIPLRTSMSHFCCSSDSFKKRQGAARPRVWLTHTLAFRMEGKPINLPFWTNVWVHGTGFLSPGGVKDQVPQRLPAQPKLGGIVLRAALGFLSPGGRANENRIYWDGCDGWSYAEGYSCEKSILSVSHL